MSEPETLEAHTIALKSAEVIAMMRRHPEWTFEQACEFVILNPQDFAISTEIPKFIPMPDEIAYIAAGIRTGEIVVGCRASRKRKQGSEPALNSSDLDDADEADSLSPVVMPSWFNAAG